MNTLKLGQFSLCLKVQNLKDSIGFYRKLGFEEKGGEVENGWLILQNGNLELGLFEGHFEEPYMLNFRKEDVFKIDKELKNRGLAMKSDAVLEPDGSVGATIEDPDGNLIYFNTHPDEL